MLVLSRKSQEQIVIPGAGIRITVLSIGTGRVQLGIEAPRDVQVTRPDARHRPASGRADMLVAALGKPR